MKFSKREWVFSIIIISLVQAFVWYAAFVNAGNGSALNFISFAGTLVSIILAVLAIGYTYGESLAQKNHSDTVVNQITSLNKAIGNVEAQTENLSQIKDISDNLSKFSIQMERKFEATHQQVESISCTMEQLAGASPHSPTQINFTIEQENKLVSALIDVRQPITEIAILSAILIDGQNRDSLHEGIHRYLELANYKFEDKGYESSSDVLIGAAYSSLCILEAIGLVTHKSNNTSVAIHVDPYLKSEFVKAVKGDPMEAGEYYEFVRDEMLKDIQ